MSINVGNIPDNDLEIMEKNTRYMIDFDRMLMIKFGFFDTEADALAWIEENVTEKDTDRWSTTFEVYKSLYTVIPIYPNGDPRLETHKYGRYSGGQR